MNKGKVSGSSLKEREQEAEKHPCHRNMPERRVHKQTKMTADFKMKERILRTSTTQIIRASQR
jgi:hypothetical protein